MFLFRPLSKGAKVRTSFRFAVPFAADLSKQSIDNIAVKQDARRDKRNACFKFRSASRLNESQFPIRARFACVSSHLARSSHCVRELAKITSR